MRFIDSEQGYVALISAIIISVVLVMIAISLSTASFFSRFNVSDAEYKKRSSNLAEACADQALLKYAQDSSYSGNEDIPVGADSCHIRSVGISGTNLVVQTKAEFPASGSQRAVTNLEIQVDSTFTLVSWKELPTLP